MRVGIDIGGTNLKAGLVNDAGQILHAVRVPLDFQGAEAFVQTLADLAKEAARGGGVDPAQLECVGMGFPGAVSKGEILYTTNIPMEHVPLADLFRKYLDCPLFVGNDADCAAVGEYFCGAGQDSENFIIVTLGTGIGGGLILNGKLYTGMGSGGEVGHLVTHPGGIPCNCGRRGCWERYASATGLIALTEEAVKQHPDSVLASMAKDGIEGKTAFQAAEAGDETALAVCRQYVEELALGVTDLVNILQPEVIALGGGVAAASDALLLNPLRELVNRDCFAHRGGRLTRIVRAELGNDAGIIGAALLNWAI